MKTIQTILEWDGYLYIELIEDFSEVEDKTQKFIRHWCNKDDISKFDEWVIYSVADEDLAKYFNKEIPIKQLILAAGKMFWEIEWWNGARPYYCEIHELDEAYMPSEDSFYSPED